MFKSSSTSQILLGVLAIVVGIIALAWPGVTILALLFGLFSLIDGVSQIVTGVQLRRTGKTLHAVLPDAA